MIKTICYQHSLFKNFLPSFSPLFFPGVKEQIYMYMEDFSNTFSSYWSRGMGETIIGRKKRNASFSNLNLKRAVDTPITHLYRTPLYRSQEFVINLFHCLSQSLNLTYFLYIYLSFALFCCCLISLFSTFTRDSNKR